MTYSISGLRETGTITYHCRSIQTALEKVQDFRRADYQNIVITNGKRLVAESKLVALFRREQPTAMAL